MRRSARLALGFGGPKPRGDQIRRTGGDRHHGFAVSRAETALRHRELETATVDVDAVRRLQAAARPGVEAEQDSGEKAVQR